MNPVIGSPRNITTYREAAHQLINSPEDRGMPAQARSIALEHIEILLPTAAAQA
ncbi:MAG: hypothetical protein ACT4OP_10605 [Actinomycetota bacterium]